MLYKRDFIVGQLIENFSLTSTKLNLMVETLRRKYRILCTQIIITSGICKNFGQMMG